MLEAWGVSLTIEVARQVRQWRVEEEYSYRGVATLADETWGTDSGGNQLFGIGLCAESAALLGENPNAEPWN
ncbi:hypothetical protein V6V47_07240 [Micromonospora sp. CPCC 205539]|uniref:hypothetical protein n=1 Tax=Micromonospora sp. CPCC 205539 TaxID=3122408 RepID=UPI002FF37C18